MLTIRKIAKVAMVKAINCVKKLISELTVKNVILEENFGDRVILNHLTMNVHYVLVLEAV